MIDARDDYAYTQASLHAHLPEQGRITVQPTPTSSRPAALAHDVLYALGKRLASGPDTPDACLDSVGPAWRAAAAWGAASGLRHIVVTRTHLLSALRLEQLLNWHATTGIQMTVLWQTSPRRMPEALARIDRRLSRLDELREVLAEPGPFPARPFFPPPSAPATDTPTPPPSILQEPSAPEPPALPTATPTPRAHGNCAGAVAAAQLLSPSPALPVSSSDAAALNTLAHPLIAGALSVLMFTRTTQITLRDIRDIDINSDVTMLRTHSPGHRRCRLYTVPMWARPLLAGARAHHRLAAHRPEEDLFTPGLSSGARHLRAHTQRLALPWTAPARANDTQEHWPWGAPWTPHS